MPDILARPPFGVVYPVQVVTESHYLELYGVGELSEITEKVAKILHKNSKLKNILVTGDSNIKFTNFCIFIDAIQ